MIKIFKFRKNDLNPSLGKQIEFNQNVVSSFFGFTNDDVEINITYKSLIENDSLNNKRFKTYLKLSPSRGDYKIYSNTDHTENIKDLFIKDLILNESNNLNDYFALIKKDNQNFDLYYLPNETSISTFFKVVNNGVFDYESANAEIISNELPKEAMDHLMGKFAIWLNNNSKNNYYDNNYDKTLKGLEKINDKYIESFGVDLFRLTKNNVLSTIEAINNNIWNESSLFWTYSGAASSHMPRAILNEDNYQNFLKEFYCKIGSNRIYFGPPGTGKSHAIKEELKSLGAKPDNYSRVTFHPDYDYHSFVGGYKPINEDDNIKYKFVSQVFTDLYVKAWSNTNEDYYLVIEEINRGNCAEIFGDVFQLLDRNPEYNIEPSSELKAFLKELEDKLNENITEEDAKVKLLFDGKLQMPNNLSILASMNTSDQSLYPMDSAFKRRWNWHYVPIDLKCTESNFTIEIDDSNHYSWLEFLSKVNDKIYSVSKSEDKQIGNWFINASKSDNIIPKELFINKVLFYLWNDVFKDEVFHPENIFIERDEKHIKLRDISFNNFHNKDEQDRLLIHLLKDILEVPTLSIKGEDVEMYIQESDVTPQAAEPNEEYENKPESGDE